MLEDQIEQLRRDARNSRAEVERLRNVLLSRHGGEPLALLEELDEARSQVERLRELNHQVIQDEIEWREKAASRLEEVERLRALLRDIVEDSEGDGPINRGLNSIQAASNYLHLRGEGEK